MLVNERFSGSCYRAQTLASILAKSPRTLKWVDQQYPPVWLTYKALSEVESAPLVMSQDSRQRPSTYMGSQEQRPDNGPCDMKRCLSH